MKGVKYNKKGRARIVFLKKKENQNESQKKNKWINSNFITYNL